MDASAALASYNAPREQFHVAYSRPLEVGEAWTTRRSDSDSSRHLVKS